MLTNIFLLLFIFAACLVITGFVFKKKWEYLAIAGSVLFLLLGLFLFNDPLQMPSGENSLTEYTYVGNLTNSTSEVSNIVYSDIDTTLNNLLAFIIMTIGLFLFIVKVTDLRSEKRKRQDAEDEDLSY